MDIVVVFGAYKAEMQNAPDSGHGRNAVDSDDDDNDDDDDDGDDGDDDDDDDGSSDYVQNIKNDDHSNRTL